MTAVQPGAFYGWPFSYFGDHVDTRVDPQQPEMVAKAIVPDYALGAHTASLGLTFYDGDAFPERYRGGAFIGQHGSWNRSVPAGYKVIFVPFADGRPSGAPEDILTGFLDSDGQRQGPPGRRRRRRPGCAPGRRRCRQRDLARHGRRAAQQLVVKI